MDCLKLKYFSDEILSEVGGLLGSGTWITYTDGSAIQQLHYLPDKKLRFFSSLAFGNEKLVFHYNHCLRRFGEEQIDQRLTSFNSRYTFSAKEKDIETGYSYFGARYYNSDLSIWLSVDPLSDKYPSLSPYVYCANNPIKLIDPNGEEVYEFDENGKYLTTSGAKGSADQILIRKADGSGVTSKEYANGTIKNDFTQSIKQKDGNSVDVSFLKITGDENAKESFEFVADNTKVEWSLTNVGAESGDKGISYLANTQEKSHEGSVDYLSSNNYTMRGHTHNHPGEDPWPSQSDMNSARDGQNKFGNIPYNLYVKGAGNFQYNSGGIIKESDRGRAFLFSMSKYKWPN